MSVPSVEAVSGGVLAITVPSLLIERVAAVGVAIGRIRRVDVE